MVKEIERAFQANLDTLAWMDRRAPGPARWRRSQAIFNKIGYPDRWRPTTVW